MLLTFSIIIVDMGGAFSAGLLPNTPLNMSRRRPKNSSYQPNNGSYLRFNELRCCSKNKKDLVCPTPRALQLQGEEF